MHPFIPVLSPSFLYHPYIPSFKSKDFSYLAPFFFCCTLHINLCSEEYIPWGYLLLFTHLLCLCRVVGIVLWMYANFHCYNCQCGPVIRILIYFKERLPEAICCCLQTCSVNVVLMIMCCMCIPAFIVTSANISQLWVYLCYLLSKAICCCLQTCNVYGAWVTLYCKCVQTFVVTCANIS